MSSKDKKDEFKFEEVNKDKIANLKELLTSIKWISVIIICFCSIACILVLFFGVLTTLHISTKSSEELLKNEYVVEYIARINANSYTETVDYIKDMGNKISYIIFDVALPSILIFSAFAMSIALCKKILDFIKDVKSNKTLFTTEKLKELKKVRSLLLTIGLLFFLAFDFKYFIIYLILELTLEIILYLFNHCVKCETKVTKNK